MSDDKKEKVTSITNNPDGTMNIHTERAVYEGAYIAGMNFGTFDPNIMTVEPVNVEFERVRPLPRPYWTHNCESCTHIRSGEFSGQKFDFYCCDTSLGYRTYVARWGNEGGEYASYPEFILKDMKPGASDLMDELVFMWMKDNPPKPLTTAERIEYGRKVPYENVPTREEILTMVVATTEERMNHIPRAAAFVKDPHDLFAWTALVFGYPLHVPYRSLFEFFMDVWNDDGHLYLAVNRWKYAIGVYFQREHGTSGVPDNEDPTYLLESTISMIDTRSAEMSYPSCILNTIKTCRIEDYRYAHAWEEVIAAQESHKKLNDITGEAL